MSYKGGANGDDIEREVNSVKSSLMDQNRYVHQSQSLQNALPVDSISASSPSRHYSSLSCAPPVCGLTVRPAREHPGSTSSLHARHRCPCSQAWSGSPRCAWASLPSRYRAPGLLGCSLRVCQHGCLPPHRVAVILHGLPGIHARWPWAGAPRCYWFMLPSPRTWSAGSRSSGSLAWSRPRPFSSRASHSPSWWARFVSATS